MPLPIGHAAAAVSVMLAVNPKETSKISWKEFLLAAFLGILPDFDYGLNMIKALGGGFHHGFTHSFFFSLLISALICVIIKKFDLRTFFLYFAVASSHAVLDYLLTESHGIALLSPFTDQRFKLEWFQIIDYTWREASFGGIILNLIRISILEFAVFAPLILLGFLVRRLWIEPAKLNND